MIFRKTLLARFLYQISNCLLLYLSLVTGFRGPGLIVCVCVYASISFPDTQIFVPCSTEQQCVCVLHFSILLSMKAGRGAKDENKRPYLLGVHHSALGNVQCSHLQHGVVGRAEGFWELVLSQLLSCILNHTLAASLSIQVPFDLQQIVNPFNKWSYEEQGCCLLVTYTACHLHYIAHGLVLTLDLLLFGTGKEEEGRAGKGREREREEMRGKGGRREGERKNGRGQRRKGKRDIKVMHT